MSFQIFGQRDPRWAGHALGSGAGEMGPYGCYETCFTMVAYDSYPDMQYNPGSFDDVLWADGVFQGDSLPDNALDRAWPDRFATTVANGFDQARVSAAVASPDTYAIVCIHNPAAGVNGYHFMVMIGAGTVADPWWGKAMSLAAWGGPSVVVKTIYVRSLRAQRDAAAAAAASQAAAAAKAKADAQAAAKAAADKAAQAQAAAEAAAKAKADADAAAALAAQAAAEEAAREAAAADAREAAAHAAADAATRAGANAMKAQPLIAPPSGTVIETFLIILLKLLGRV